MKGPHLGNYANVSEWTVCYQTAGTAALRGKDVELLDSKQVKEQEIFYQ